ncbi:hypothetical protein ACVWXO_007042 [Bradyrhizobium sp. LM2.7]
MDIDLRNGLWQACNEFHFRPFNRHYPSDFRFKRNMDVVFVDFFKMPSDTVPYGHRDGIAAIRDWFFKAEGRSTIL